MIRQAEEVRRCYPLGCWELCDVITSHLVPSGVVYQCGWIAGVVGGWWLAHRKMCMHASDYLFNKLEPLLGDCEDSLCERT